MLPKPLDCPVPRGGSGNSPRDCPTSRFTQKLPSPTKLLKPKDDSRQSLLHYCDTCKIICFGPQVSSCLLPCAGQALGTFLSIMGWGPSCLWGLQEVRAIACLKKACY